MNPELCGDFQRGRCVRGTACRYKHEGDIRQRGPNDPPDEETQICRDFQRGRCIRGENCRFRHVGDIPQRPPPAAGVLNEKGEFIVGAVLPPPVVLVPAPVAMETDRKEEEGISDVPSAVLGLSEVDIAKMTADELIVHIETLIRQKEMKEQAYLRRSTAMLAGTDAQKDEDGPEELPPLPPLPKPTLPTFVRGVPIKEVHEAITELAKAVAEQDEEVAVVLSEAMDEDLGLAMFQVLRECGLLMDSNGNPVPMEPAPPPPLPPGYRSWIVIETTEEKAARLRREREEKEQAAKRKRQREQEYQRYLRQRAATRRREARCERILSIAIESLKNDHELPGDRREWLEAELKEVGPEQVEDLLDLPEEELAGLDPADGERIRTIQNLLLKASNRMHE